MCRITRAAQSPFVDYNPIDILMGIKKVWWRSVAQCVTGTGGAVCKGATPSVEQ